MSDVRMRYRDMTRGLRDDPIVCFCVVWYEGSEYEAAVLYMHT